MTTATFLAQGLRDAAQATIVEQRLKVLPHIVRAEVNLPAKTIAITYHEQFTSPKEISSIVTRYCKEDGSLPTLTSDEAFEIFKHKSKVEEEEKS